MSDDKIKAFLLAADDRDCRAILDAVEDESKSVKELSEECEIPLSTAYRKIDRLQNAGLVEEKVRLSTSGSHANVYERCFDGAVITIANDGDFELELVQSLHDSKRPSVSRART